ncbi:MAG: hypothetical protein QW265_03320 [Candidatus Bathyarchaeia archaeon]
MKSKDEAISLITAILLTILVYLFYTVILKIQPPLIVEKSPIEKFLWTYRGLDILAQSFLVFAAAVAIASLFRTEKKEGE